MWFNLFIRLILNWFYFFRFLIIFFLRICYIKNIIYNIVEVLKKIEIVKDFKIVNYIYGIMFIIDIVYF